MMVHVFTIYAVVSFPLLVPMRVTHTLARVSSAARL